MSSVPRRVQAARAAGQALAALDGAERSALLSACAEALQSPAGREHVLAANAEDLRLAQAEAAAGGLAPALVQRLRLDAAKLAGLAEVPVIKVATRSDLARRWHDLMDVNAGTIADGSASIEEVGWQLFHLMLEVASGRKKTWAEHWKLHNALVLFNPAPVT